MAGLIAKHHLKKTIEGIGRMECAISVNDKGEITRSPQKVTVDPVISQSQSQSPEQKPVEAKLLQEVEMVQDISLEQTAAHVKAELYDEENLMNASNGKRRVKKKRNK